MMKTILSTVAALAVMTVAGAAMAQDAPAADSASAPPAKHHHMKKHKATEAADKGDKTEMKGHKARAGEESSAKERAETEKLNEEQLAGSQH